jgi:hypothetical protein
MLRRTPLTPALSRRERALFGGSFNYAQHNSAPYPSHKTPAFVAEPPFQYTVYEKDIFGGDLASTWVAKPEVHAEVQSPRKTLCKLIVANDDNYALAA